MLDLLPAYALGALDEDEIERVVAHLADCPSCRTELQLYQELNDHLALGAPEASPPAALRGKLMARIAPAPENAARDAQEAGRGLRAILSQSLRPRWALAGLMLLLGLVLGRLLVLTPSPEPAMIAQEGDVRVVRLAPTAAMPAVRGHLIVTADGEYGTLIVEELPALPSGRQYQVWLEQDGRTTKDALLGVSEEGYGVAAITAEPLSAYSTVMVTVEPTGASSSPTGPEVLEGQIPPDLAP